MNKGRLEAFSDGVMRAVSNDWKGKLSPILYVAAIAITFRAPWLAQAIYACVALIWLVPDRRIEHALRRREASETR